jgi:hypothetical protein
MTSPESLARRFRVHAVVCALLFLAAELISRPYTTMGVADDWSYILTAKILAQTGHIVYNGWATAMIGWQLYAGALFLKLFGDSFTAARMSTLVVAVVTVFLIQRVFVRSGITERNATIGTLSVVLTPIFMQLSVTFMTDIEGLFAIVLCLYACIRAVQSLKTNVATAWICFAIVSNVVLGSARQIGWLGALVMVPATLWLLREHRRLVVIGCLVSLVGWVGIFACMHWFTLQPYSISEPILVKLGGLHGAIYVARQMVKVVLESPFLVLPVLLVFLPYARRGGRALTAWVVVISVLYAAVSLYLTSHHSPSAMLEPLLGDWFIAGGFYHPGQIYGPEPVLIGTGIRLALTILSTAAMICVIAFVLRVRSGEMKQLSQPGSMTLSWKQVGYLVGPFVIAYLGLLLPRATGNIRDRYLLEPAFLAALCMVKLYQEYVRTELPGWTMVVVLVSAFFSVGCTHDLFSMYRARTVLADEIKAAGIAANTVDGAFEYNGWTELQIAGHLNDARVKNPPNSIVAVDPNRGFRCSGPEEIDGANAHLSPLYGLSYTPNACAGLASVAPVQYSQWLTLRPATLYVVKFRPVR